MADQKETPAQAPPLQFILKGFSHELGYRVFSFDGIASDRTRAAFTVRADLALARKYSIPLQELPLLCRDLLVRRDAAAQKRAYTYGDGDMREHAGVVAAREEAAKARRPSRRVNRNAAASAPDHLRPVQPFTGG